MDRTAVIATLRAHQPELARAGIRHAALFGSVARGDARADSDIDVMIEFEPDAVPDVFTYVAIKDRIAGLFPVRVDVVDREALRRPILDAALADMVYAF
jgi:predicted nucleotidyltransferase